MNTIQYKPDALIITISCHDAAAKHAELLHSLTALLKHAVNAPEKEINFGSDISAVVNFLTVLLPGERELAKAYEV